MFAETDFSPQKYRQVKRRVQIYQKANWENTEEQMKKTHLNIENKKDTSDVDPLWNTFRSSLQKL